MKLWSAILSISLSLPFAGTAPAFGDVAAQPQVTTIVCPVSALVSVSSDHASQGWTGVSNAHASFKKAEVVNAVGLAGPSLTCAYAIGADTALEVGRLSRPEPLGMLCTVDAVKSGQFDCFPRPGATSIPAPPASHH